MISLNQILSQDNIKEARAFEHLRNTCKKYLSQHDLNFDKFTIVSHDSFIGYVTELSLKEYILERYSSTGITVLTWEDKFDMDRIKRILNSNSKDKNDIQYAKSYFYDKYDLQIRYKQTSFNVDIKTALTKLNPKPYWNFLYPVVQAHKEGKDLMLLAYYVVKDSKNIESLHKIVVPGYISEDTIRNCKMIKAGSKTRFGTTSQIDNYETELSQHYKNIDEMMSIMH